MADKGIVNPAFEPDVASGTDPSKKYGPLEKGQWQAALAQPKSPHRKRFKIPVDRDIEMQGQLARGHIKSASVGTPMKWNKKDSVPGRVLRAWRDAQIRLDMENVTGGNSDSDCEKTGCKNKESQTEEPYATLSSWKILITEPGNDHEKDTPEKSPEYVIMETRSLGFEVATQTRDAFLFRFSDAQAFEMVMAWRMITVFLPITWYLIMYVADQATDIAVTVDFCSDQEWWWCGFTLTFLIVPSLIINGYAYEQLVRPDIASVAPVNKWFARALVVAQIAPHYLIARKWSWCYRAWRKVSWKQTEKKPANPENTKPQRHRKSAKILFEQAQAETYSESAKWYQSFLESTPQLSIQAYVLMDKWQANATTSGEPVKVPPILIASVIISLASASAGLASMSSDKAWERIAAAMAIFLTLGSRVLVCSGIGSIDPAYWVVPLASSVLVGVITKICESKDNSPRLLAVKLHKYFSEAFVMATVCPPYNALGVFTSIPYALAGLVFLLRMPENPINILTFVFSIVGQVVWLALGFFIR